MTDKPQQSSLLEEYMDVPELAKQLNKAPRTIWRWRAERKGPPATWIGGKLYFRRSAAKEWLLRGEERLPA